MKTTCLLRPILTLTMSCATLMLGTSYAAQLQQTSAKSSANASGKNRPRSRVSRITATHPKQLPIGRKRSTHGNTVNLHQPDLGNPGSAAKSGVIQHEAVKNAQPVRRLSVARPTLLALNNVHHRGPNPAFVGGSANLDRRNSGAIDGTRMHRKP